MRSNSFSGYNEDTWRFINSDLVAVPFEERTWNFWDYASIWCTIASSLFGLSLSFGLFADGFLWWHIILIILLSQTLLTLISVANGKPGAKYGLPFVVLSRSSFGIHGSIVVGLLRALVASIMYGVFTWNAGLLLDSMLRSWGVGFEKINNVFPSNFVMTSQTSICFFATWLVTLSVGLLGPRINRYLFRANAIIMLLFVTVLTVVVVAIVRQGGPLLSSNEPISPNAALENGGAFANQFISSVFLFWMFFVMMVMNISDFTRFAESNRQQVIGQAISLPFVSLLFSACGMILLSLFMSRFNITEMPSSIPEILTIVNDGVFTTIFCTFFYVSYIIANVAFNGVAGAYGFSNVAPSFINYRLGITITAFLGAMYFPWLLVGNKTVEMAVEFVILLVSSVLGVMLADYYVASDEAFETDELYYANGRYWFFYGFNWRGFLAIMVGMLAAVPGIVGKSLNQPNAALVLYFNYSWLIVPFISFVVYIAVTAIWPDGLFFEAPIELNFRSRKNSVYGEMDPIENISEPEGIKDRKVSIISEKPEVEKDLTA
ncbi:hypothetical protein MP638_006319 [Amoeboaphelidium occidentale]|nr:hypothetical protein MP638_006319 [Amoeboaphelidium occidentale]